MDAKLEQLEKQLQELYLQHQKELLFHGWHHVQFIRQKALEFAQAIGADMFLVESAALTHDLNYIVKPFSDVADGTELRQQQLTAAGYNTTEIQRIEQIITESDISSRGPEISLEGKALSDADTLFKALPITPILFTSRYLEQNKVDIQKLAQKIGDDQNKLFASGIYFYTDLARGKYLQWAETNLKLWNNVQDSLQDPAVQELLENSKKLGVL